jgi:hypothetical protein
LKWRGRQVDENLHHFLLLFSPIHYDYNNDRYWSPSTGRLSLGHFAANDYHCFGPNCYQLTGHLPTSASLCLAHVAKYDGNVGTDPLGATTQGLNVPVISPACCDEGFIY